MTPRSGRVTVGLVYGRVSIAAGGSYWPHYLVGLVPFWRSRRPGGGDVEIPAGRPPVGGSRVAPGSALVLVVVEVVVYASCRGSGTSSGRGSGWRPPARPATPRWCSTATVDPRGGGPVVAVPLPVESADADARSAAGRGSGRRWPAPRRPPGWSRSTP